jgi:hypothetical protein
MAAAHLKNPIMYFIVCEEGKCDILGLNLAIVVDN